MASDQPHNDHVPAHDRPRIETQIHRRKKAKAFSSLEPEWDQRDHALPAHLRMPANRMAPTPPNPAKKPS